MKKLGLLLFAICPSLAMAHAFEKDGIYYVITSATDMTVAVSFQGRYYNSYDNEYTGDVTIPETTTYENKEYRVASINDQAFCNCVGLTSVTLPNSITKIGDSAFSGCTGLLSVMIPNSVTGIGNYAFKECTALVSVDIGDHVTWLGSSAFEHCSNLNSMNIPEGVKSMGDNTFNGCSALTSMTLPGSLTKIGKKSFVGCTGKVSVHCDIPDASTNAGGIFCQSRFSEAEICDEVTSIGNYAFQDCIDLVSVSIPSSVTNIGRGAFEGCKELTEVSIPANITKIEDFTFEGCASIQSVTIPNSITYIGNYAFHDCCGMQSLTIPSSVTSFGSYTFKGCTGRLTVHCKLTNSLSEVYGPFLDSKFSEVEIGDEVTEIGNKTFYACTTIRTVSLPEGLTRIGTNAFRGCSGLQSVVIPESVTEIGQNAFAYCSGMTSITLSNDICNLEDYAFDGCKGLTEVNIRFKTWDKNELYQLLPKGIAWNYMVDGEALTSAVVPDSVSSIGNYALYACKSLREITIPDHVTQIGRNAFEGCAGLESVTIPNSVTRIETYTFYGCSGLQSMTVPESVIAFGEKAFAECTGKLTVNCNIPSTSHYTDGAFFSSRFSEVEFGESVRKIGNCAFYECDNLELVTIPSNVTDFGFYAFRRCTGKLVVECDIPSGSQYDYGIFYDTYFKEIVVGEGVKEIGDYAFYHCGSTTLVTIPSSVRSIGKDAFVGCTGKLRINCNIPGLSDRHGLLYSKFSEVEIGDGVTYIGDCAFNQCHDLNVVTIPESVTSIGEKAFKECDGILSISLPSSVTSIGWGAFEACTGDLEVNCEIPDNAFYGSQFSTVVIGDGVTTIGLNAFSKCASIQSLTIPNSVTTIDRYAFASCSGIATISMGNGVKKIDDCAFNGCSALTTMELPEGLESIGENAFGGCMGLELMTIPSSVKKFGNMAFSACTGKLIVHCDTPDGPNNTDGVFVNAYFTEVEFADGAKHIGNNTFFGCHKLLSLTIGDSVETIGHEAFCECQKLASLTIGNNVTSIEANAFYHCNELVSLKLGDKVQRIGYGAFLGCNSLETLTIPNNLTTIEDDAFGGGHQLQYVICSRPTPPSCERGVFSGADAATCVLYVPRGSINAYRNVMGWSYFEHIEALKSDPASVILSVIEEGTEITEQNVVEVAEFKLNLMPGVAFAVNDDARVELWIGGVLKGLAENGDIDEANGVVTVKFRPVAANARTQSMQNMFWMAAAAAGSEDVDVIAKITSNSFRINEENIEEDLCFGYTSKASVAEMLLQILAIDEIMHDDLEQTPTYHLDGSRVNGNNRKGFIIQNGNKVWIK